MKICIVDDDKLFASKLHHDLSIQLSELVDDTKFDICISDFSMDRFSDKYDFVFLDIDLPHENGIMLAKHLKENGLCQKVVFVTSHQNLIYDTLSVRPFYFIRKNCYEKDLNVFMEMFKETIIENDLISIRCDGENKVFHASDIIYIETVAHFLDIYTMDTIYHTRMLLKECMELLSAISFVQIHKSYVINLNHLVAYHAQEVTLSKNITLTIGRKYKDEFMKKYQEFLIQ